MMVLIIPGEEAAAEDAGRVDGLKPFGEFRLIFQCLEVGFRERVVIRGVWTAVGFDHAEIGQHQGGRLCLHRPATVGVQGKLAGRHGMPGHGVEKRGFEQGCTFGVPDPPADDPPADHAPSDKTAAEDVGDDVSVPSRLYPMPGRSQTKSAACISP